MLNSFAQATLPSDQAVVKRLLHDQQIDLAALQKIMAKLHNNDLSHADIYIQSSLHETWVLQDGIIKSGSFSNEQGVAVRSVFDDKSALAYSGDISLLAIEQAADVVAAAARTHRSSHYAIHALPRTNTPFYSSDSPLESISTAEKKRLLQFANDTARNSDARVTQVNASLSALWEMIFIMRLDGSIATDIRPLVRFSVSVLVEEGKERQDGFSGGGGRFGWERFGEKEIAQHVNEAVRVAVVNLQAQPAKAGEMPVVLGAGWPGILLHEAVGHGLEGDFNRKGTSAFSTRMGQQVAARGVTVVDDGTIAYARGSLNVDDEGTPTGCQTLIEDGILCGYLQDVMNANLMKMPLTGNGRRESYAALPMPRMTNTYMQNGKHSREEIIASVKDGIYAVNFSGGQVDITSGKFVFSASEAYRIENGKVTHPIKGATLIGSGADALQKIKMVGNDLKLDPGVGTCGKEGQSVPVGVGQPSLRIDGLVVGGTH